MNKEFKLKLLPSMCEVDDVIQLISKISKKPYTDVEKKMFEHFLYPESGNTCYGLTTLVPNDKYDWFYDALDKVLEYNDLDRIYITYPL